MQDIYRGIDVSIVLMITMALGGRAEGQGQPHATDSKCSLDGGPMVVIIGMCRFLLTCFT